MRKEFNELIDYWSKAVSSNDTDTQIVIVSLLGAMIERRHGIGTATEQAKILSTFTDADCSLAIETMKEYTGDEGTAQDLKAAIDFISRARKLPLRGATK